MKTALAFVLFLQLSGPLWALDTNSNGLSDVWEWKQSSIPTFQEWLAAPVAVNPLLDPDGDGATNAQEEQAGLSSTMASYISADPEALLEPGTFSARLELDQLSNEYYLRWWSVAGKLYQVEYSLDLIPGMMMVIPAMALVMNIFYTIPASRDRPVKK